MRAKAKGLISGIAGVALCLLSALSLSGSVTCYTYHNSRAAFVGYDLQPACAYTGGDCTECVDSGGNYCVGDEDSPPYCDGPDFRLP